MSIVNQQKVEVFTFRLCNSARFQLSRNPFLLATKQTEISRIILIIIFYFRATLFLPSHGGSVIN